MLAFCKPFVMLLFLFFILLKKYPHYLYNLSNLREYLLKCSSYISFMFIYIEIVKYIRERVLVLKLGYKFL